MAVPDFQTLILPLLQHIADGNEYTIAGSRDILADRFELTDKERNERLPSGAANRFHNRLAWAKIYLERAGLIEKIRRGCFKISSLGSKVLVDPPDRIDINFLNQFAGFADFRQRRSSNESTPPVAEAEIQNGTTPEEALEDAYLRLRDELAAEILTQVRQAHPAFFEQLVVDLMLKMGYGGPGDDAGSVTPYGSDGGIDGIINEDRLGLDVIYLQAKRWENTVGRPEIQKFVGALHGKRAKKGVFLSTGDFSADAVEYVKTIDPRVALIDGMKLAQLMVDHNVGVSTSQTYNIKKLDSDYFDPE